MLALGRSVHPETAISNVTYASIDAVDTEALETLTERWLAGSKLNGVCLAMGISLPQSEALSEADRFSQTMEANLQTPFAAATALRSHMAADASVVFVTSINSLQGFPDNPGYVAAKTAISGLARALALDWGVSGTRVNSLALGYFPTAMTAKSYADNEQRAKRAARTTLGRWGRVEEAAAAAAFLLGPDSSYVTGQMLVVDGGWTAKGL